MKKSCRVTNSVSSNAIKPIIANRPLTLSAYWFQPKLGLSGFCSVSAASEFGGDEFGDDESGEGEFSAIACSLEELVI